MWGKHLIKSWSATQTVVALSSGEAEYYGLVKASSVALGVRAVMEDLGVEAKIKVHTDASAAKGIASRRGAGKVKHIEVNQLWLQQKVSTKEIDIQKIPRGENIADALTKYVSQEDMNKHLWGTHQVITAGRHEVAPTTGGTEESPGSSP